MVTLEIYEAMNQAAKLQKAAFEDVYEDWDDVKAVTKK